MNRRGFLGALLGTAMAAAARIYQPKAEPMSFKGIPIKFNNQLRGPVADPVAYWYHGEPDMPNSALSARDAQVIVDKMERALARIPPLSSSRMVIRSQLPEVRWRPASPFEARWGFEEPR